VAALDDESARRRRPPRLRACRSTDRELRVSSAKSALAVRQAELEAAVQKIKADPRARVVRLRLVEWSYSRIPAPGTVADLGSFAKRQRIGSAG
jgi:hypothetical protein